MKNHNEPHHTERRALKARARVGTVPTGLADNRASYVIAARELSDFHIPDGRVDVRKWPVFAAAGRLVGVVERLMVEPSSGKVRYIAVALIDSRIADYRLIRSGSVLVPIGLARRIDDRHAIKLDAITSRELDEAPRLRSRAINRGDEDATLEVYGLPGSRELPSADYYKRPEFDESLLGR